MKKLEVDLDYLQRMLLHLLATPSPTGYTDVVVHAVCRELELLQMPFELTRRGAVRATLQGGRPGPGRALIAHVDTLGAMVKNLKENGRLQIVPIGTWSARFAEGARVTLFTDERPVRGTILPLKASGHIYNEQIDTQPVSWENVELRLDERVCTRGDLVKLGIAPGDYIAVDPRPEISTNGFINSRHLDDKAGVACLLAAAKACRDAKVTLPINTYLLFTISEEVGSGASAVLHGDVAEMVAVDNGTSGPEQNGSEYEVTAVAMDMAGPFDYHLTHHLLALGQRYGIPICRDVFKHYRCDAASAVEAGNDIRTALLCFGCDASHGYERTHLDSLRALTELLGLYLQSRLLFSRDKEDLGPIRDFPYYAATEEDGEAV